MTTNKTDAAPATPANPRVAEFLNDPKHQEERDFMNALIDLRMAQRVTDAQAKTKNVGGDFFSNFIGGMTGDLFGAEK